MLDTTSSRILSERDREILDALTLRVRFFSLEQLARQWWTDTEAGRKQARERLEYLRGKDLVARELRTIRPELDFHKPLTVWKPGEKTPDFRALSYQAKKRWRVPGRPTVVYHATRRAANQLGGFGGKLPRALQLDHDLNVSRCWVLYRRRYPKAVSRWVGEELLRRLIEDRKNPDAAILTADNRIEVVVEFAGGYGPDRIEADHLFCEERGYPYHLW